MTVLRGTVAPATGNLPTDRTACPNRATNTETDQKRKEERAEGSTAATTTVGGRRGRRWIRRF